MDESKLYIYMLGGFTPIWHRKVLDTESAGAKVLAVWQALLYAGRVGVHRDALGMRLYGELTPESANSLRALIFRLRNYLDSCGMDGKACIRSHAGYYIWSGPEFVLDTNNFLKAISRSINGSSKARANTLLKAAGIYKGRMLPDSTDSFLIKEADRLEQQYIACLEELQLRLSRENEPEKLLKVAASACKLLPGNESWTLTYLDCLINLGRNEEALQFYRASVAELSSTHGIAPSDAMMQRYRELISHLSFSLSNLTTIQADLWEKDATSSYYCSYPGFVDCYRLISRGLLRDHQGAALILCTLTDLNGVAAEPGIRQENASKALYDSIGTALRSSDLYTRYSPSQFLVLVNGMNTKYIPNVVQRIRDSFSDTAASWGFRLQFESAPATPPAESEKREEPSQ